MRLIGLDCVSSELAVFFFVLRLTCLLAQVNSSLHVYIHPLSCLDLWISGPSHSHSLCFAEALASVAFGVCAAYACVCWRVGDETNRRQISL
jgi:hypothetical protein